MCSHLLSEQTLQQVLRIHLEIWDCQHTNDGICFGSQQFKQEGLTFLLGASLTTGDHTDSLSCPSNTICVAVLIFNWTATYSDVIHELNASESGGLSNNEILTVSQLYRESPPLMTQICMGPDVHCETTERTVSFACRLWINISFDLRPCIEPSRPTDLGPVYELFTHHHTVKFTPESVCVWVCRSDWTTDTADAGWDTIAIWSGCTALNDNISAVMETKMNK